MAAIAALATGAAIGVHYVGGLFGGLLAGAIAFCAFARRLRRWAALVLATAVLSGLFVVASIALQAPSWAAEFDHSWIDLPGLAALGVLASLAVAPLWLNPVPFAGLWMGPWMGPGMGKGTRDASETRFVALIGIVLAVHAVRPIVVDRYLFAVPVLVSALMAVPAARFAQDRLLFAAGNHRTPATAATLATGGAPDLTGAVHSTNWIGAWRAPVHARRGSRGNASRCDADHIDHSCAAV
jgi:hypothetical protein